MLSKNILIMWLILLLVFGFWLGTKLENSSPDGFNAAQIFEQFNHQTNVGEIDETLPLAVESSDDVVKPYSEKIFGIEDSKVLGIEFYMNSAEMKKILGNPTREELSQKTAGAGNVRLCYYDFGTVQLTGFEFDEPKINGITILKPGYSGPRGVQVGASVDSVTKLFPYKPLTVPPVDGDLNIYKEYGQTAENSAYIRYQGGKINEICYVYENFYCMRISVVDNFVKSIELYDASIM